MAITAKLNRFLKCDHYTLGKLFIYDSNGTLIFWCYTLELPWRDNKRSISCIPVGSYFVKRHTSPTFGKCYYITGVPDRSQILFHVGNYPKNTNGCVLLGSQINIPANYTMGEILGSRLAFDKLLALDIKDFSLKITELC